MVKKADKLRFQPLKSELEALLVEAELIRLHQPQYNILLKDDKSALYIHITDDPYPQVKTIRKKEIITTKPKGTTLGPFQSSYKVREVLKLVRPIFKWCNNPHQPKSSHKKKACFYYHIDQCSGACLGQISVKEYQQNIAYLKNFLKGKTKQVVQQIKKNMGKQVANEEFEKAAISRDQIQLIKEVTSTNKKLSPNLTLPQLKQSQIQEGLLQLNKLLSDYLFLPIEYPLHRIEGYDVSNIQGTNPSVAMVTFIDGQSDTSEYKLFNIRTLNTPNDYGMMKEALLRRSNHPEWGLPDLLIIDGGKGQLRAALTAWQHKTPIISIAKKPDRIIIPSQNGSYHVIKLNQRNPALKLIQQVRDESHRFSKKQHTKLRRKKMLKSFI